MLVRKKKKDMLTDINFDVYSVDFNIDFDFHSVFFLNV